MADVEELESKVNAQALQIKLLNEGQHKVNELIEEKERLQKEHKDEMEKVKAQAKQAYLKLKQQLEAKEEQIQALKGAAPALGEGEGEGGPDGAASKLEMADQRLAELEAQLQKATLETDKVKSDAKKYVETLKKKEQEALSAARLATERMHEAQASAAEMQARLEGELARISESESGQGAVDSGELAQLRDRIAELEGQVESVSRKATEEASQSSAAVQMLQEQLVQAASEADAFKEAHAKLQSYEQVIAEGQRQLEETRSALEASNAQAAALAKEAAEFEAKALQLAGEIAQASQGDADRMSSLSQNLAEWQDRAKSLEEAYEREQQQVASVQEQLFLREEHSKQLEASVVALETSRVEDALASQQQIQSLNQQLSEWQARANQLEELLVDETRRREQSEADKMQALEHAGQLERMVEEKREELERGLREHQTEKVRLEEMLHEARQAAAAAEKGAPEEAVVNEGVSNGEALGALATKSVESEKEREELCRLREEQVKSKELMREMVDKMRAREAEKEAAAAAAIAEKDAVIAALEQHKVELLSQIQVGGQEKHGGEVEATPGAAGEAMQGSSAPGDDVIKSVLAERDALLGCIRQALGCDEAGDILGMLAHAQAEKEESRARLAELTEQMREVTAAAQSNKTQQQAEVGLLDDQPLISFGFDSEIEGSNAGQVQGAVMVDEAAAHGEGEPEQGQGSLMQNVQQDGGDLLGSVEETGLQQPMPVQAFKGTTPAMDTPQSQAAEAWPQDPFGFEPFAGGMPQGEQNSVHQQQQEQQQQQQQQAPLADEMSMQAPDQSVKEGAATETRMNGQTQREEKDTEERGLLVSIVSRLTMSDENLQGNSNLSLLEKINGYFDVARKEKAEVELQLAQQVKAWEASKKELEDKIAEETTKSEKFRRQFDKGTASHKEAMGKLQQDMANEHEKALEAEQRMEAAEAEREALQKVVDGLTAELNKMREHVAVVGIESIQKRVEQLQSRCDDIENQGETSKEDIGQLQTLIIEETTLISNMAEELTSPPSGASQPRLSLDDGKVAIDTLLLSMEDLNMRISELTQQNEELRKQADEGTALKAEKGSSSEERALVEALMPKVGYEGSIEGESTVFLLEQLGPIFDTIRKEKVELELNLSKEQRALQSSMEEVEEERANAVKQMEISEKLRAQNQKSLDSHKKREQNLKDQQSSMQEEMDKLVLENEQLKLSSESKGAVDPELKSAYDALVEAERATADEILSLKEEISEKKKRITEMKNSFSQGMEASKLHVAHLENTIKELQEGAEKATRTAESAVVGTEERSTMVHDEPAEIASRAHAPATGLQNGQGTPGKLDGQGGRAFDKEAPHDDIQEGLRAEVEMLKKEVAELNARVRAEGVPQEYLKEVVLKYVLSSPQLGLGPREHEDMIPIIADLMHFSESDRFNVARTQERAKNKSILSAATSFLWDPSRY